MGRSPFFNVDSVTFPAEKPACAAVLADLQPGQRVRITCDPDSEYSNRAHRTPSNYGYATSSYYDTELIVDHINIDPTLNKHGVRAIAFRNPELSKDSHYYTWYATTDGFVRECEHYGIMQVLATVEVIE
jgi:hypothetical protein